MITQEISADVGTGGVEVSAVTEVPADKEKTVAKKAIGKKKKKPAWLKKTDEELIEGLYRSPTTTIPIAGRLLAGLSPNSSYQVVNRSEKASEGGNSTVDLGVEVFWVGGLRRVTSISVLKRLDLPLRRPSQD
jgi:hypothetical protein